MDMPSAVTSYIAKRTRKEKRYWQCCSHHCKPSNSSWRMRELIDKIKANKLELKQEDIQSYSFAGSATSICSRSMCIFSIEYKKPSIKDNKLVETILMQIYQTVSIYMRMLFNNITYEGETVIERVIIRSIMDTLRGTYTTDMKAAWYMLKKAGG